MWPDTLNTWQKKRIRRIRGLTAKSWQLGFNNSAVPNGWNAVWNGSVVEIGLEISPAQSPLIWCYPLRSSFSYKYPGRQSLHREHRKQSKICELRLCLWGGSSLDGSSQGDRWRSSGSRSHNLRGEEIRLIGVKASRQQAVILLPGGTSLASRSSRLLPAVSVSIRDWLPNPKRE